MLSFPLTIKRGKSIAGQSQLLENSLFYAKDERRFKLDTFISILREVFTGVVNLINSNTVVASIVASVGAALVTSIISGGLRLLRKGDREPDQTQVDDKLCSIIKTYRNSFESNTSTSLNTLTTNIPLTLHDSKGRAYASIADMYKVSDNWLILGKAGSGKSTFLRQSTLELINTELKKIEESPEKVKLPIFVPLHEWAKEKQPFKVYLAIYLRKLFGNELNRSFVNSWLSKNKFILLLDALDEMNMNDAQECVDALHKFSNETLSPIIISCQADFYETLVREQHSIEIKAAEAIVQTVKLSQGQDYLKQNGAKKLSGYLYQENKNPQLREIADTPLMLQLLAQTYPDAPDWRPPDTGSEEKLWENYIMHELRTKEDHFNAKSTKKMGDRLTQLAVYMDKRKSPIFYFRPDNLPDKCSNILYLSSTWLIILLFGGVGYLLMLSGKFALWQLLLPMIALIAGFYGYLFKSILTELCMILLYILTLIYPSFSVASSNKQTPQQRQREVAVTLIFIFLPVMLLSAILLICARVIGIPLWLGILAVLLIEGLLWYTFYRRDLLSLPLSNDEYRVINAFLNLVNLMIASQVEPPVLEKFSPKTAIPRTLKKVMSIGGLIIWVSVFLIWQPNLLLVAILIGISAWLDSGPGARIRGYVLHFWFWQQKILPWPAGFLGDAVTFKFLKKERGGYSFFYGTRMQDYFRKQAGTRKV